MCDNRGAARCIMVQGTGSHTGKSVMVAALCRILAQDGWRVAPYKSQNMSLNSFVTSQGGEMGRAQVLQAQAAGVEPHTDMNPILLKPASDERAQVILNGRPVRHMEAGEYHLLKPELLPVALGALERLRADHDFVVIEGAGSPAEINLADQDIANMRVARAAGAPVILVGDIDRGGVFASLVGTMELLDISDRDMVAGFIINKFRGSRDLLQGGLDFLELRTGRPILGVIPYIRDLGLEEEDTVNLEQLREAAAGDGTTQAVDIAIVYLPHISNATDFDPLAHEKGVGLRYVSEPSQLGVPDAVILPGSKSTADDLDYLRNNGMAAQIVRLARLGVPVIGICGGYQMLGEKIEDPLGVESAVKKIDGLGLLPVTTVLTGDKSTHRVTARATRKVRFLGMDPYVPLTGYEIHMGNSQGEGDPPLLIVERNGLEVSIGDGSVHPQLPVFGCYLHGIFENASLRHGFLNNLRRLHGLSPQAVERDWEELREERIDRLARIARASLNMPLVYPLLGL
jgi:adenosylcobyric acid synthase